MLDCITKTFVTIVLRGLAFELAQFLCCKILL